MGILDSCRAGSHPKEPARGFYAGRGVNVRDGDLDAALKLFTMKRCMRAVAFLADLPESQRDAEVMTEVADRMQMMEGLVSSLSALGRE